MSRSIFIKLTVFVIGGLLATAFVATQYLGFNPLGRDFKVTVALADAGGLFENGEVTYRGVPVGRVEKLTPTENGMEARLRIDASAPAIPANSQVFVANRSSIGEQYIDLRGEGTAGPHLRGGERLVGSGDSLPPDLFEVLRSGRDFVASVPEDDLGIVIDEAYEASRGASQHVRRLIDTSNQFVQTAESNFLVTQGLIENSATVLDTQVETSQNIQNFSRDLALVAETLADSDANLRDLISNSPAAAHEIRNLFDTVGVPLGLLMSNLITPAEIFSINHNGVEDALIRVPEAMSIGWAVNGSKGLNLGLAQTYFNPWPCTTGYGGTKVRDGLQTSGGEPLNLKAGCVTADKKSNVRGPKAVPMPKRSGATARVTTATSLDDLFGGGS